MFEKIIKRNGRVVDDCALGPFEGLKIVSKELNFLEIIIGIIVHFILQTERT